MKSFPREEDIAPYAPSFPPGRRWLFFAPHPDDETLGSGATLALAVERGVKVRVVIVTEGQAQGEAPVRQREALAASAILGLADVEFWGFQDRSLSAARDLPARIIQKLRLFSPDLAFFPSPLELHPDHRALAWHGQRALRRWTLLGIRRRSPAWVAFYEVGSALWPNLLVAGESAWEKKQRALASYKSQLAFRRYAQVMEGLADFRTLTLSGATKAEAFALFSVRQVARRSFSGLQRLVSLPGPPFAGGTHVR